jgi:hypothetical protein
LTYEKPEWSGLSHRELFFEVVKGGVSLETIQLPAKEFIVIGK